MGKATDLAEIEKNSGVILYVGKVLGTLTSLVKQSTQLSLFY